MSREKFEQELRGYFRAEVQKKEPPQEWWDNTISSVTGKKPEPYTLGLASKIKTGINIMRGFLTSKQPIWRTALIVLALVLMTSLSVILPSLFGQDKDAMATEGEIIQILKSDSRTKALLDDGAIVSFLEEDYTGGIIARLEETIDMMEDRADMTIIAYEIDIMIMAQRILVELSLGDKHYLADVDVTNGEVLTFGEKGDPEFRTIYPRFDVDVSGEMLNEKRETFPFTFSYVGGRGFEGIESYIDLFYEKSIFFTVNYQSPLMPLE